MTTRSEATTAMARHAAMDVIEAAMNRDRMVSAERLAWDLDAARIIY